MSSLQDSGVLPMLGLNVVLPRAQGIKSVFQLLHKLSVCFSSFVFGAAGAIQKLWTSCLSMAATHKQVFSSLDFPFFTMEGYMVF